MGGLRASLRQGVKTMKIKQRICGILAFLSFVWLLGVAGNSDLGLEPDLSKIALKLLICLVVFAASIEIGGFTK